MLHPLDSSPETSVELAAARVGMADTPTSRDGVTPADAAAINNGAPSGHASRQPAGAPPSEDAYGASRPALVACPRLSEHAGVLFSFSCGGGVAHLLRALNATLPGLSVWERTRAAWLAAQQRHGGEDAPVVAAGQTRPAREPVLRCGAVGVLCWDFIGAADLQSRQMAHADARVFPALPVQLRRPCGSAAHAAPVSEGSAVVGASTREER